MRNPFRYFNSSPEVIRLAVMMYIRYPLSLRQVEDLLFERGIDICHETVRYWWNRFGPMFAAAIRKRRLHHRSFSQWRWHLDEVFVRINGETHYLWRAVDHEGEVLEVFATKRRDRRAALRCHDAIPFVIHSARPARTLAATRRTAQSKMTTNRSAKAPFFRSRPSEPGARRTLSRFRSGLSIMCSVARLIWRPKHSCNPWPKCR